MRRHAPGRGPLPRRAHVARHGPTNLAGTCCSGPSSPAAVASMPCPSQWLHSTLQALSPCAVVVWPVRDLRAVDKVGPAPKNGCPLAACSQDTYAQPACEAASHHASLFDGLLTGPLLALPCLMCSGWCSGQTPLLQHPETKPSPRGPAVPARWGATTAAAASAASSRRMAGQRMQKPWSVLPRQHERCPLQAA